MTIQQNHQPHGGGAQRKVRPSRKSVWSGLKGELISPKFLNHESHNFEMKSMDQKTDLAISEPEEMYSNL